MPAMQAFITFYSHTKAKVNGLQHPGTSSAQPCIVLQIKIQLHGTRAKMSQKTKRNKTWSFNMLCLYPLGLAARARTRPRKSMLPHLNHIAFYYIDTDVLLKNILLVKFIKNTPGT